MLKGSPLEQQIIAVLAERLARPCLLTPSGRIALYLALRNWISPGERVLMSPLTDDVILFIVLAAGCRPVFAPLSADDGNIDPDAVLEETWTSVSAVLTTNMYGLPDRAPELRARCRRLGIPLLEDAAHAFLTDLDGRPIGTFGEASAFSMSKHLAMRGGVLACSDRDRLAELAAQGRELLVTPWPGRDQVVRAAAALTQKVVHALHLTDPARWAYRRLGLVARTGDRMPLRPSRLRRALALAGGVDRGARGQGRSLDRFERWARVDRHEFRWPMRASELERILTRLRDVDRDRAARIAGVERLQQVGAVAPAARRSPALPLFRVPLLLANRDEARAALERRGIYTSYIYDPPLDDYAGLEFGTPSSAPEVARFWARHVLPVDPLDVDRVLDALKDAGVRLIPAEVPSTTTPRHPPEQPVETRTAGRR